MSYNGPTYFPFLPIHLSLALILVGLWGLGKKTHQPHKSEMQHFHWSKAWSGSVTGFVGLSNCGQ